MDQLILLKPTKALEKDIKEYCQEYFDHGETWISGSGGIAGFDHYDEWLESTRSMENEEPSGTMIPASTYFSVRKRDQKIIGSIQLRHSLSEKLKQYGGHIGYGIRPSERRMGYGTEQLALVLKKAKELSIPQVMISCDKDNPGSAKVIKNNGGVLQWEGLYKPTEKIIQIYWIVL